MIIRNVRKRFKCPHTMPKHVQIIIPLFSDIHENSGNSNIRFFRECPETKVS